MPAKSEKQQRFMAAVANNPEFAKKVGVPKSVGEEFMKKKGYMGGGMMRRYADGGMMDGMDSPGMGVSERDRRTLELPQDAPAGFNPMMPADGMIPKRPIKEKEKGKKKTKKAQKSYKYGGKVRGCGMASKGVRPAKMVKMAGV